MLKESPFSPDGSPHEAIAPIENHVRTMQRNAEKAKNPAVAKIVGTMALLYEQQTQLAQTIGTDHKTINDYFPPDEYGLINLFDNEHPNLDSNGNNKGSAHIVRAVIAVADTLMAIRGDKLNWSSDTPWLWGETHPGVISDDTELREHLHTFDPDTNSGKETKQGDIYDMFSVSPRDFKDTTQKGLNGVIQRDEAPTNVGVALVLYKKTDVRTKRLFTWIGVKPPSDLAR